MKLSIHSTIVTLTALNDALHLYFEFQPNTGQWVETFVGRPAMFVNREDVVEFCQSYAVKRGARIETINF